MTIDMGGASGHVNFKPLIVPGVAPEQTDNQATVRHGWVGKKGDLQVELHYGDFHTGHGRQAALMLKRGDVGVFVPLTDLWKYLERDAFDQMIPPLTERLYGFVTPMDQVRVMDAVLDYLGELHKSPPDPVMFKDRTLQDFLTSCEDEGLEFGFEVNGKRVL